MENFDYAGFKKKYGLNVSPAPLIEANDEALEKASDEMYYESRERPRWAIPRLEKLIARYPEETQFLNFLYVAYATSGQDDLALKTLERTMRSHPNYVFGPVNYVLFKPEDKWILAQGPKLGKNLSLTDWPARADGTYHQTELLAFERAAIIYLVYQGKTKEAKARLNRLLEFGAEQEDLKVCIDHYQLKIIEKSQQRRQNDKKLARYAEHAVTTTVTSADADQPLTHPEVDDLRNYDLEEMTEQKLDALLALPRKSLITDLRNVLRSSIGHYIQKYELDEWYDLYDECNDPDIHALYLLGALGATEALPEVLDYLRIDEEAVLDIFDDFASTLYQPTLFALAKGQPAVLIDYLLEPKNYHFDRTLAVEVLVQIALHFPNRRAEVLDGFRQIWQRMLDQPNDHFFVDTFLSASILEGARVLRATELLPLAREMEAAHLINTSIAGAVEDIEFEFHRPLDAGEREPQPATPYEYYSEAYQERKAPMDFPLDIGEFTTPLDMILVERMSRMLQQQKKEPATKTYTQATGTPGKQKIGRNEPCPCGSGKKYKKCCL